MEVKYINPFVDSFFNIMAQIGFNDVKRQSVNIKDCLKTSGVSVILDIIGDIKGNVIYTLDLEGAKQIASTMLMGSPVNELDDMAQSAIAELSNMLTANASTKLSQIGKNVNISTPSLSCGENLSIKTNSSKILSIGFSANGIPVDLNIALEE